MGEIITDDLPKGVPLVTDFNHPCNRLDYYHPRLVEIDVPTPETRFFKAELEPYEPKFDERAISEFMVDKGWKQAFVRGMYASAKIDPREGSHLQTQDREGIRWTVKELIVQHIMMERPLGGRIAVREYINLDYCPSDTPIHDHKTEVRYFIRNGRVLYRFPPEEEFISDNLECDDLYSYVRDDLEAGVEYPDGLAEQVAAEFSDLSWSVDFVRHAKTGEWFCPDMGLNGLYWNERNGEWVSISEHENAYRSPERFADQLSEDLRLR